MYTIKPAYDENNDGTLSYHESIMQFATYGHLDIGVEKAKQMNCESCFKDADDFY